MSSFEIQLNGLITLVRKEVVRCLRISTQIFFPPVITMALYYLIFGKIVGSQIAAVQGYSYIQYISPGLIMMSVLLNSYINTSSSFFGSKFSRAIEEILVSPMKSSTIVLGYVCGGVFRGVVTGVVVMLVSLFFTHLSIRHPVEFLYTIFITSVLFSLVGIINGVYATKFDDVAWIPSFIITPLTYFAGVFYSISQLPDFWRQLSLLNPIYYIVSSFRFGMLDVGNATVAGFSLFILTILTILLFLLTARMVSTSSGLRQ